MQKIELLVYMALAVASCVCFAEEEIICGRVKNAVPEHLIDEEGKPDHLALPGAPAEAVTGGYRVCAEARKGDATGAIICKIAVLTNGSVSGDVRWEDLAKNPAARVCGVTLREGKDTVVVWPGDSSEKDGPGHRVYDNLPFDAYKMIVSCPAAGKWGGAELKSLLSLRAEKPKSGESGDIVINGRLLNIDNRYRELILPPALEFRTALPLSGKEERAPELLSMPCQAYAHAKTGPEGVTVRALFHTGPKGAEPDLSEGRPLPEGPDIFTFETGPLAPGAVTTVIMSPPRPEHPDAPLTVSYQDFPIRLFDHLTQNPNIGKLRHSMRAVCELSAEPAPDGAVRLTLRFVKLGGDGKRLSPLTMGAEKIVRPMQTVFLGKTE
jgi:hypothetical protein